MPPEAFLRPQGGATADVWALGVILSQALAGEHPFPGDWHQVTLPGRLEPRDLRAAPAERPPDAAAPARPLDRSIARPLVAVCLGALARAPAQR